MTNIFMPPRTRFRYFGCRREERCRKKAIAEGSSWFGIGVSHSENRENIGE
jgi:hypothetical protein